MLGRAGTCTRLHRGVACHASGVSRSVRLAVVGDIHNQWSERDVTAFKALSADYTVFVGDVGNENVQLVQQIAQLRSPTAVILGNHDAWYTMTRRRSRSPSPAGHKRVSVSPAHHVAQQPQSLPQQLQQQREVDLAAASDSVQQQLNALGDMHVGYAHKMIPGTCISLVGARPFSKGGKSLRSIRDFLRQLYGVSEMQESADMILNVINTQVPPANTVILVGHNGPAGLGSERYNICGVDWVQEAGDHGDPDLQLVLQQLQQSGRPVELVVFGHMHHTLKGGGKRQMVHVDPATGCVYLNAATVPRVMPVHRQGPASTRHHFLVVDLLDGQVHCAADVWVEVMENVQGSVMPCSNGPTALSGLGQTGGAAERNMPFGKHVSDPEEQQGSQQPAHSSQPQQPNSTSSSRHAADCLQSATTQHQCQLPIIYSPKTVDRWIVQVVQVNVVLKTLPAMPYLDTSIPGHPDTAVGVSGQHSVHSSSGHVVKQWWDAYNSVWHEAVVQLCNSG